MSIVSVRFLLFAGLLLLLYYRVSGEKQWQVLLAGSVLFAGLNGSLPYIALALAAVWLGQKKPCFAGVSLTALFGVLALCKVKMDSLPFGISFFTFQAAGYLLELRRGTAEPEDNPLKLGLFLGFFPQLVQGPISRKRELQPLFQPHSRDPEQITAGIHRMLWGYFKKLVIAQRIAPAVAALHQARGPGFMLLTIFYAVEIYGDFTGGIDIALGLGQCFGIGMPENFCRPFLSRSVAEYWRRWHITLGSWMKDFVFYPLSVSAPMRRFSRFSRKHLGNHLGRRLPVWIATMATWLVTGIWHGITPNFALWGAINGAVILISQELEPVYAAFHRRFALQEKRWYGGFQAARTFLLMNLIRVCDLFPNVAEYGNRLVTLFSSEPLPPLGLTGGDLWVLALGIGLLLVREHIRVPERLRPAAYTALGLVILIFGKYGIGYDAGAFIYNQF